MSLLLMVRGTVVQHNFFLAPTSNGTGLTSVCLGLVRALEQLGVKVAFFKPISQLDDHEKKQDRSIYWAKEICSLQPAESINIGFAQACLAEENIDALLEMVIQRYQQSAENADVVIVEGLVPTSEDNYITRLNALLAKTLNAEVIIVATQNGYEEVEFNERLKLAAMPFGGAESDIVLGCILNKIGAPQQDFSHPDENVLSKMSETSSVLPEPITDDLLARLPVINPQTFRCLGRIAWDSSLVAPRTVDVARHLNAKTIVVGDMVQRRVRHITLCASKMSHMLYRLKAGALVVTPGDRDDILLACSMATLNKVPLAGILLTGGYQPDEALLELCSSAFSAGLTVLSVKSDSYTTARCLNAMNPEVPIDDVARMEEVMDKVAAGIDVQWLAGQARVAREERLSPPAFKYLLAQRANKANKKIVLPEGEEPRTIKAAAICQTRGIARCVLLGRRVEILRIAGSLGVELPLDLEIIEPDSIRADYIQPMVELRKHKGLTEPVAEAQLEDTVVLATMMLAQDHVDGLVSGAIHTTANTVRPALQLIKTKPSASLVSSVFFMCLPDQVLVYGDCAINPDPSAEDLADIAIQSNDSAAAFGIEPRIAMISYSTGVSGTGADVEKVREATRIAKEKRPDMIIDGPLQYDAAAISSVAMSKAPDSPVAGRATVFVFPDLNTGNTTYKAVQRSANVISVGPMLQGLKKPVNDLSRGALVDDIVYTIALTAIQADQEL